MESGPPDTQHTRREQAVPASRSQEQTKTQSFRQEELQAQAPHAGNAPGVTLQQENKLKNYFLFCAGSEHSLATQLPAGTAGALWHVSLRFTHTEITGLEKEKDERKDFGTLCVHSHSWAKENFS